LDYFSSAEHIVNKTRSLSSSLDSNIVNMPVYLRDWCCWDWSSNFRIDWWPFSAH